MFVEDVPEGRIRSAFVQDVPFDEAVLELNENGYRVISAKENLALLIQEGVRSHLLDTDERIGSNRTREGYILFPLDQTQVALVKDSPALAKAEDYAQTHIHNDADVIAGREFYLSSRELEKVMSQALILPHTPQEAYKVPVQRFNEDKLTRFLFEEQAGPGGDFLKEAEFDRLEFFYSVRSSCFHGERKPFLKQLWFSVVKHKRRDFKTLYLRGWPAFGSAFTRVRGIKTN